MNQFTDIVFIFVFVFVILHFGMVNITTTNVVTQKLYIFLVVTIFSWLLFSLKSIRRQCPIKVWDVVTNGLIMGILAYVGHTLFFDMLYMPETNQWITNRIDDTYFTHNIMLSIFISISIMIGKTVGHIFYIEPCN